MAKKVVKKISKEKEFDKVLVAYILGILSIVQAFFVPLAGLVLGIIGLVFVKKEKSSLAIKSQKLNTVGIVISAVFFVAQIVLTMISYTGLAQGLI
jgi:hypothetical protein